MEGGASVPLVSASANQAAAMLALPLDLDGANNSHTVGEQPSGHVLAVGEDTRADSRKMTEKEIVHRLLRLDFHDQQVGATAGFRFFFRIRWIGSISR